MKTYHIEVIGCKVNQYEAQQISELLERLGLRAARRSETADLAVVHSCAVTSRAISKSRKAVSRFLRQRARTILVSGCAARWAGLEFTKLGPTVKLVPEAQNITSVLYKITSKQAAPNTFLANINQGSKAPGRNEQCMMTSKTAATAVASNPVIKPLSNHIQTCWPKQVKDEFQDVEHNRKGVLGPITGFSGHQRAFVKVQDGCDAFCSYCLVPYLRPTMSWRSPEKVLQEIEKLVSNGYREVVLTGIHLGAYGQRTTIRKGWTDYSAEPLANLLRQVAETEGLERVRLSSLEPGELSSDELVAVMAENPIIAKHLHLPLQSGSEEILKRMNRKYTPAEYLATVEKARRDCGQMAISTDIIVGFPGETDEDFRATMAVAEQVRFVRTHVFEFSPRAPTAAAEMSGQVPKKIRQQRSQEIRKLGSMLAKQHQEDLIGRELRVLVENKRSPDGLLSGLCEQYFSVRFESERNLAGHVVPVLLEEVDQIGARGRLLVA